MLPKADHCSFKSLKFVVKCTNVKKRGKYKMLQSVKISELPSADTLTEDDLIVLTNQMIQRRQLYFKF